MWKSFFLWTAKIQRRQQQPKAKKWTLTFRVRLYDILIHWHWLRFPTLCNTKFGSHNSIHEIERRKKSVCITRSISFERLRRWREKTKSGNITIFVCEHFVENSLWICVFVVSSFDVKIQRIHWHEMNTIMLPSIASILHQNIQPLCYWYTQLYSCDVNSYDGIWYISLWSTSYAVFRPTPSDCTFQMWTALCSALLHTLFIRWHTYIVRKPFK